MREESYERRQSRALAESPFIPHLSIITLSSASTGGAQSTNSVCVSRFTAPTLHAPTLTCYARSRKHPSALDASSLLQPTGDSPANRSPPPCQTSGWI